jgi:hypothetical protein
MSNLPPWRSPSPGAVRMRRYRKHQRAGLRSVRVLLGETDIDALIRMEHLKDDERQGSQGAPEGALTPPLPGRGGPRVTRNGREPVPDVTRNATRRGVAPA